MIILLLHISYFYESKTEHEPLLSPCAVALTISAPHLSHHGQAFSDAKFAGGKEAGGSAHRVGTVKTSQHLGKITTAAMETKQGPMFLKNTVFHKVFKKCRVTE